MDGNNKHPLPFLLLVFYLQVFSTLTSAFDGFIFHKEINTPDVFI